MAIMDEYIGVRVWEHRLGSTRFELVQNTMEYGVVNMYKAMAVVCKLTMKRIDKGLYYIKGDDGVITVYEFFGWEWWRQKKRNEPFGERIKNLFADDPTI